MHAALHVDEIIRHIFYFSSEHGHATLNALARCCRVWEGPALDYLWTRLSSIAPLLELIPSVELLNGVYVRKASEFAPDMTRFCLYASRVKHISHQRRIQVQPEVLSFITDAHLPSIHPTSTLPSLLSAQLSASNCDVVQTRLSLSSRLCHLDLDLGFKKKASNEHICQYLQQITQIAPGLQRLSIRGSLSDSLSSLVSSMCNLRSLSLRLGSTLTTDTLLAVLSFPNLVQLEIHAGHIDVDAFSIALAEKSTSIFPALTQLHVRAHTPVLALILEKIPVDNLEILRIEAEEAAGVAAAWGPVFSNIKAKAANSLKSLTVEHHIEIDDTELESASSADTNGPSPGPPVTDNPIPFSELQILGSLRHLTKFVFDTTLPSAICDEELATLVKGWPELQHLDLGLAFPVSKTKSLTFRSLSTMASKMPKLGSLVMAADLEGISLEDIPIDTPSQHILTRITLACAPPSNLVPVVDSLRRLFPSLLEVEGLPEHEDGWSALRSLLFSP
ncbi:hypothetical protein H0H92_006781 [Tricholoma furcatifolium]|nr:hypothetical protein H0H92_006781 [Tricholoma furcatifolium]